MACDFELYVIRVAKSQEPCSDPPLLNSSFQTAKTGVGLSVRGSFFFFCITGIIQKNALGKANVFPAVEILKFVCVVNF